jgi:hypothetical protein
MSTFGNLNNFHHKTEKVKTKRKKNLPSYLARIGSGPYRRMLRAEHKRARVERQIAPPHRPNESLTPSSPFAAGSLPPPQRGQGHPRRGEDWGGVSSRTRCAASLRPMAILPSPAAMMPMRSHAGTRNQRRRCRSRSFNQFVRAKYAVPLWGEEVVSAAANGDA